MKQKNTVGLIAVITAVIGFVFACIPGALIVGWILLPIAFILGIVGLFQSGKAKGTSIAAVIIAIVGTIVGFIVFFTVVTDAVDEAFGGSDLSVAESNSGDSPVTSGDSQDAPGSRDNPFPSARRSSTTSGTSSLVLHARPVMRSAPKTRSTILRRREWNFGSCRSRQPIPVMTPDSPGPI
ncbi:hypothetical protein ACFQZK_17625 [Rhodococcus aetherivorans]